MKLKVIAQPLPIGAEFRPGVDAIPETMFAYGVRSELRPNPKKEGEMMRVGLHGQPADAIVQVQVPVPKPAPHEVLVYIKAAGHNFNGSWAAQGMPVSPFAFPRNKNADVQILGSDAAGIVVAVGAEVTDWKLGDEGVLYCGGDDIAEALPPSGDSMEKKSFHITGYEDAVGWFSQFTAIDARQVRRRPQHLSWEDSSSYGLCAPTSYRALERAGIRAGSTVLVWGAAGGTGDFAIKIARALGAKHVIGVVSSDEKGKKVLDAGATGFINRKGFDRGLWGQIPVDPKERNAWRDQADLFKNELFHLTKGCLADVVIEHPGEQTYPVSNHVLADNGRIAIFAGTTGYKLTFEAKEPSMALEEMLAGAQLRDGSNVVIHGAYAFARQVFDVVTQFKANVVSVVNNAEEAAAVAAWDVEGKYLRGVVKLSDFIIPNDMPSPPHPLLSREEMKRHAEYDASTARPFRDAVRALLGKAFPDIIVKTMGTPEQTLDLDVFTVRPFGSVILAGPGIAGTRFAFDVRFLWMFQKRVWPNHVGTHYANHNQTQATNDLIEAGQIAITPAQVFDWKDLAHAQQVMLEGGAEAPKLVTRVASK